jgi:CspA family cold shock protein
MKMGVVKEYNPSKGFGFITGEDKDDYFVHMSGLREYFKGRGLRVGQKVSFDVDFGMRGDKAINVRLN